MPLSFCQIHPMKQRLKKLSTKNSNDAGCAFMFHIVHNISTSDWFPFNKLLRNDIQYLLWKCGDGSIWGRFNLKV